MSSDARGNTQCATSPGSAVSPCIEYEDNTFAGAKGSCRRLICTNFLSCAVYGQERDNSGVTANTPSSFCCSFWQCSHVRMKLRHCEQGLSGRKTCLQQCKRTKTAVGKHSNSTSMSVPSRRCRCACSSDALSQAMQVCMLFKTTVDNLLEMRRKLPFEVLSDVKR